MEALTILILCGAGLILMIAYLMYRIGSYKKKVRIRGFDNMVVPCRGLFILFQKRDLACRIPNSYLFFV
jgi:hypothetical protein